MSKGTIALVGGACLIAGFAAGFAIGHPGVPGIEREIAALQKGSQNVGIGPNPEYRRDPKTGKTFPEVIAELDQAKRDIAATRERLADAERRLGEMSPESAPRAATAKAAGTTPKSPEEIKARLASMPQDIDAAFAAHDGSRAVSLLKELRGMGRDGWPLAMKLMTAIQKDMNEGNSLSTNSNDFYKTTSSPEFTALHLEALQNPKDYPSDFRTFSAYTLPWLDGGQDLLLKQIATEQDPSVLRALCDGIQGQPSPQAVPALLTALQQQTDEGSRKALAQALSAMPGDDATRALEALAQSETDPTVKAIAANAYAGRTAGVPGFLVTSTLPGLQAEAAGLQAGDVVTTYRGIPITSMEALDQAKQAAASDEVVDVVVRRNGKDVTVQVRAGQLGINGTIVKPAK